jgi:hypothetical protein
VDGVGVARILFFTLWPAEVKLKRIRRTNKKANEPNKIFIFFERVGNVNFFFGLASGVAEEVTVWKGLLVPTVGTGAGAAGTTGTGAAGATGVGVTGVTGFVFGFMRLVWFLIVLTLHERAYLLPS